MYNNIYPKRGHPCDPRISRTRAKISDPRATRDNFGPLRFEPCQISGIAWVRTGIGTFCLVLCFWGVSRIATFGSREYTTKKLTFDKAIIQEIKKMRMLTFEHVQLRHKRMNLQRHPLHRARRLIFNKPKTNQSNYDFATSRF